MNAKDQHDFVIKAQIYKKEVDKIKSMDDVDDKFYEISEKFLTETDKAAISDEFQYRSYKFVYESLTFFNDGAHNTLICRSINSLAQDFFKKFGNKNLLDNMGKSLYFNRLGVDRYLVAQATVNLKKHQYKGKEIAYLGYLLKEYKREIAKINKDKDRAIAIQKLAAIDTALAKEASATNRINLYKKKIKTITAKAFGRKKSFEMKASVCNNIIRTYMLSYATLLNSSEQINFYKTEKEKLLRNAALSELHAGENNTYENRKKYMNRFYSRN